MTFRTRFAPSPTGPLHLGHAYSALIAHDLARSKNGKFFLRLDDIDQTRSRAHWADQITSDLSWLGITWDGPIWSQNTRSKAYSKALHRLWDMGLLYPCTCSRADIKVAASAPQEGAAISGPDGIIYPGTCRGVPKSAFQTNAALRINIKKALQHIETEDIKFFENDELYHQSDTQMIATIGDVVLARKNMDTSYHLSIVVDDAEQGITDVIRGEDLREATYIHVLLQKLLGLRTPNYIHHRLIRDENAKRLAKRDDARAISKFREDGLTRQDIYALVGLKPRT
ncbi:tRNA glutamyl-Q(34) synthetase GluQRS [bacterium]|nr:tRNA glutamyl-Q(34) synthetase GluQRS [bacterium]